MTTAKTMAEVLAEHPDWWWGRTEGKAHCDKCEWSQSCDPRKADNTFRAHQAAALSAAGFGLVADAGAKALEDAADAIEPLWFNFNGGRVDENESRRAWLRARARAIRSNDAL